ncbi:MAG TPA: porphobilinogen synthase [Myxococcota bacterium]|nr:porphobilinogen synthase [Myxococcota bacterium]HQK52250.1 porphobilinogen synthase [Myxococcota bacterium]
MGFPERRMRRLRKTETLRRMVRETRLTPEDFIYPLFVAPGRNVREPIPSMPGQFRLSVDETVKTCREVVRLGIPAVILFGIPEKKDPLGTQAYNDQAPVQRAIRALKKEFGDDLCVITDVCLCEYTDHGHCGLVEKGQVLNDPTLELLAKEALSHAKAGADMVAPSDMMDGRIGFLREELDEAGFEDLPIMAYSAKHASAFYGPFRDAADSAPKFGDRRSYQMDPANGREALMEMLLDEEEGADILMVKPAGPCLDLIRVARDEFELPLAAYQVSGEFAMLKAAAEKGWLDHDRAMMESLIAIRRAGADLILTYFALEAARLITGK